jgi:hypothetical protein
MAAGQVRRKRRRSPAGSGFRGKFVDKRRGAAVKKLKKIAEHFERGRGWDDQYVWER